jgi:hypothetical protein
MLKLFATVILLGLSTLSFSQEGTAGCVILKRMGPADQITSHFYAWGIRGKQYQYVEGNFPKGYKFHGRLTDHDVREIQNRDGKIVVIESKYTPADIDHARQGCAMREPTKEELQERIRELEGQQQRDSAQR